MAYFIHNLMKLMKKVSYLTSFHTAFCLLKRNYVSIDMILPLKVTWPTVKCVIYLQYWLAVWKLWKLIMMIISESNGMVWWDCIYEKCKKECIKEYHYLVYLAPDWTQPVSSGFVDKFESHFQGSRWLQTAIQLLFFYFFLCH